MTDRRVFGLVLKRVLPVFKDHTFLDSLMYFFQFFDVWFVRIDALFVFLQTVQLVLQSAVQSHSDSGDGIQLTFDPRSDGVRLLGELTSQHFVVWQLVKEKRTISI